MTAGINPGFQPNYQYNQGQNPTYMQQPAMQYAANNQMRPQYQPQTQQTTQAYQQNYPQENYAYPQTPGIVNYVTPPVQNQLNATAAQNSYPSAYPGMQAPSAPQGQPQALSNIPVEQNPLNMNSGMNAQMPAPNMQDGQSSGAMNAQAPADNQGLNLGVVDAPENFSKTPVMDELNRRGQSSQKASVPNLRNKKTFTLGNVSAACTAGSLLIILTMALTKIVKLIKHK